MRKINLGFIGIGQYCRRAYISQFSMNPNVEIVGAYDPDPNAFIKAKEECGIELKSFAYPEHLMTNCDAIIIASPDKCHMAALDLAIRYGVHTLVEKPVCTSGNEYNDLEWIFHEKQNSNLIITTCHPRRFDNAYIAARDLVQGGKHGKLLRVELSVVKTKLANPEKCNNSLLQDHLCHEVDTFNFFMGGVQKLDLHKLADGPTRYEVSGTTADGVSVYFSSFANIETQGSHEETIILHFESSKFVINCGAMERSYYLDYKTNQTLLFAYLKRDAAKRNQDLVDNFINSVLGKEDIYLSREEVLASAATILIK